MEHIELSIEKIQEKANDEIESLNFDIKYAAEEAVKHLSRINGYSKSVDKLLENPEFNPNHLGEDQLVWVEQACEEYKEAVTKLQSLRSTKKCLERTIQFVQEKKD